MIYFKKILLIVMIVLWYFFLGKVVEWKIGVFSISLIWLNVVISCLIELYFIYLEKVIKFFMKKEVWKIIIIGLKM